MSDDLPARPDPAVVATAAVPRRGTGRRLLRNPLAVVSLAVLILLIAGSLLAPVLAPQGPADSSLSDAFAGPSSAHPLGMDSAGRDILSRLLHGGRNTLGGAVIALALALLLGVPAGLYAGYRGGWFDAAANWTVNLVMALPAMVVLLASRAILGPNVWVLMIVLGVLAAPSFFRLVRGIVANVRGELYVDAARVSGLSDARIVARHVLTVVRGPIIIQTALVAGIAIALQAGLEFLGVGSGSTATWGAMLNEAFQNIQRAPALLLWPGLALGLTNATLVLLAAALRDVLEDRTGKQTGRVKPRTSAPLPSAETATAPPAETGTAPSAEPGTAAERAELLSLRGVRVAYAQPDGTDKEVVHGVDLDIGRGEIVGLVGESGSGKTQTAFSVLGILPEGGRLSTGSILLTDREIAGLPEREHRALRGTTVAYIPQEPMSNLDPAFTVGSQLAEPMRQILGLSRKEAAERSVELLRQVEIPAPEQVVRRYPHEISGGMAQRVLIAGAISCDPALLIADEPTTALDVRVQAEILDLLRRLREERDLGVLLVTHNLGVVADLCDRVAVMNQGRIVETGTTEQVLHEPQDPYTRDLLGAVLDSAPAREPWRPRPTRPHPTRSASA
ncbi:dipeptide/oligopeptide/nickel ABC transporter permease/ATP-binding protein [Streptomyces sp. NPDC053750]|uniref:dipeptide/oligopeptide/nickel ABC transporter permease/ATP-binding protein n=1 Tax=Streptomyces sp. NPDC053750 TaxID=3365714 RepID=UPI0037D45E96